MEEHHGRRRRWVVGKISGLSSGLRNLLGAFRGCFVRSPYKEMDPEQELDWDYLQVPNMDSTRSLPADR